MARQALLLLLLVVVAALCSSHVAAAFLEGDEEDLRSDAAIAARNARQQAFQELADMVDSMHELVLRMIRLRMSDTKGSNVPHEFRTGAPLVFFERGEDGKYALGMRGQLEGVMAGHGGQPDAVDIHEFKKGRTGARGFLHSLFTARRESIQAYHFFGKRALLDKLDHETSQLMVSMLPGRAGHVFASAVKGGLLNIHSLVCPDEPNFTNDVHLWTRLNDILENSFADVIAVKLTAARLWRVLGKKIPEAGKPNKYSGVVELISTGDVQNVDALDKLQKEFRKKFKDTFPPKPSQVSEN